MPQFAILAHLAKVASFCGFPHTGILLGMKKTNPSVQTRSVRRWFRRVFDSIVNCEFCNYAVENRERLLKLEDLVDTIAREVARQAKLWDASKRS